MKTITIAELNASNVNGRTYTTKAVNKALLKLARPAVLGTIGMPRSAGHVDLFAVSHKIANLRVKGNRLLGDLTVLATPAGIQLSAMMTESDMVFRLAGTGTIENGIVSDLEILSINAVSAEATV